MGHLPLAEKVSRKEGLACGLPSLVGTAWLVKHHRLKASTSIYMLFKNCIIFPGHEIPKHFLKALFI